MAGLIEEIQRDALDDRVPIDSLLRRVKLAAAKLQLNELSSWVEQELRGYSSNLPDYREIIGQPAAWNPYNGWIPVHAPDERILGRISVARVAQSVSSLRALLDGRDSDGILHFPISDLVVAQLNKIMSFQTARMVIQIPRSNIVGLLDHVRNLVLDWAIEMERQGITGEGMSFSVTERQGARNVMANYHIGNIGSFVGNMGEGNSTGDITVSKDMVLDVSEWLRQVKSALPELGAAGADTAALDEIICDLKLATEQITPDPSRFQALLIDARAALSGAAGNLTAAGAISGIDKLLKMLGLG